MSKNDGVWMEPDELREHLKEKSEHFVGTADLEEANRRFEVLHEWRWGK